jgi:hypothetical protein
VLAPTWWRTNGGPDRISCYLKTGKSLSASVVELPSTSPLPPRVPRRRGTPVLPLSSLLFPCPFLGGFISEPAPSPFRCRCSSLPAMQHTTTTTRRSTTWLRPGGVPGAVQAGGSWDGVPGAVVGRRWWAGLVLGFFPSFNFVCRASTVQVHGKELTNPSAAVSDDRAVRLLFFAVCVAESARKGPLPCKYVSCSLYRAFF